MNKYYGAPEIIKMLPYLKSYSKDIKKYFSRINILVSRLINLSEVTSINPQKIEKIERIASKIRTKIFMLNNKIDRWESELKTLFVDISDVSTGRLALWGRIPWLSTNVIFYVLPETTKDSLEWHFDTEQYDEARKYIEYDKIKA